MRFTMPYCPTALVLILAAGAPAGAAPVTALAASQAAGAWLQGTATPLEAGLGTGVAGVASHVDSDGRVLFHQVTLTGGGFLVLAPDDALEPVIAFAPQGSLEADPENHLLLMLEKDLRSRLNRLARARAAKGSALLEAGAAKAAARWQTLMASASADALTTSVSDVRVAPLVTSTWSQTTVSGLNVYNYYTPNNDPSGCVATAMAQLMRYHQHPTSGIGALTFAVTVDSSSRNLTTRGGNGTGGAYTWATMPLNPASAITSAQQQMIGALCYDAGVAVNMAYTSSSSGAYMSTATKALRSTFQFTRAIYGYTGGELTGNGLTEMVQPCLDAGYPVLFGISGTDGGHAVVCDGYGYTGTTLYHHLNLGWGGTATAWYNLPSIATGYYDFDLIDSCIYNTFPSSAGEILSGRITDAAGSAVVGVTVTDGTVSSTTDSRGIYALKGTTVGTRTISATKSGLAFPGAVRILGTSSDGATVGNVWGVDLVQGAGATPTITPAPAAQTVKLGGTATFTAGATGLGTLSFQWSKGGTAVGTDSPTYTTAATTMADDQAAIGLKVTGSQGSADATPVALSVVRLFNGDFEKGNSGWSLWDTGVVLGPEDYTEVTPHGGDEWLCIGDWSAACTDYAMQDIVLPASGTMNLSFWAGIANKASAPTTAANIFKVMVLDTSGNTLATLKTLDNTNASVDSSGKVIWASYGPYSLSTWKGQTVRLRIQSVQPGGSGTGTVFAVDDITLATAPGPTATLGQGARTIATGGQASFTASVTGYASSNAVAWSASPALGTFSSATTAGDGTTATVFTAGTTAGTTTVTATPSEADATAASTTLTLVAPASVTVGLVPSATTATLNQAVTLAATVTSLTDASVTWTATGGTFSATGSTAATWSSASAGTFTLTATSAGAPTRSASVQVTVADLSAIALALTPASAILLPGGTATFTASGDLGYGVAWTLTSPATHADSGLSTTVTAPAATALATATYTLTATHVLDATKTATATVTVKGVDLDGDGALGVGDLLAFAGQYGKGTASAANFKGTGTVDDTDLATLLTLLQ